MTVQSDIKPWTTLFETYVRDGVHACRQKEKIKPCYPFETHYSISPDPDIYTAANAKAFIKDYPVQVSARDIATLAYCGLEEVMSAIHYPPCDEDDKMMILESAMYGGHVDVVDGLLTKFGIPDDIDSILQFAIGEAAKIDVLKILLTRIGSWGNLTFADALTHYMYTGCDLNGPKIEKVPLNVYAQWLLDNGCVCNDEDVWKLKGFLIDGVITWTNTKLHYSDEDIEQARSVINMLETTIQM